MSGRIFDLQDYARIVQHSERNLSVLDGELVCLYSSGSFEVGERLDRLLHKRAALPIKGFLEGRITRGDHFCCVRIYPLPYDELPQYYLCELIDSGAAMSIAKHTDAGAQLTAVCASLQYQSSVISELSVLINDSELSKPLREASDKISCTLRNVTEYLNMNSSVGERVLCDVGKLLIRLCESCNNALANVGRNVWQPVCETELYIRADARRVAIVLMNAIQNALLYSPVDAAPQIVAYRESVSGDVVIKTINPSISCDTAPQQGRAGLGIALIRRFAELAGGSVMFRRGENATLMITLPGARPELSAGELRLEQGIFCQLEDELSQYVRLYMGDIEKTTAKIQ